MITIVSALKKNSEPFDDCKNDSIKDKIEILEHTLRDYYRRIEAYKTNREVFHCDAFVITVKNLKKMIESKENGLAHFCDYRWYVKKNGWSDKTLERMGSDANYVCKSVAEYGRCSRSVSDYCDVQPPCMPNCEKCLEKLRSVNLDYVLIASGHLLACHAPLDNVLPTQAEVVGAESGSRESTTIERTRTSLLKSDVFILVIPNPIEGSYLQSGDGSSQISATINAPQNDYARYAAHALVKGELHIFGGRSDGFKIARLDSCSFNELPARLNEQRRNGHAALSTENGQKALVCFGYSDDTGKSCEIFDGSSTVPTFAAEWTHAHVSLGLYNNQPATVGCNYVEHQKAETLSATGWTALPDHPRQIFAHSLVGLDNGAMMLLGGYDSRSYSYQTGIWELKDEWSRIGELSKPAYRGSAIYASRSVYYFDNFKSAIHRLDLDENEELETVEEIGSQPGWYLLPVLFQTDNDYCT